MIHSDKFVIQSGKIRVLYCRIIFKGGFRLVICWLMMKLFVGLNKELMYLFMHVIRVGFKRLKFPRMAYIISC